MVKLDKIYTKTGDRGKTRLSTGQPVDKWHLRIAAYGTVDETNAALGVAALHATGDMLAAIRRIQNDLFDLGADLATPDTGKTPEWTPLRIIASQVERLETEIDAMNADLAPLDSFVLPGSSALAAHLHVARTLTRRAERKIAELADREGEKVSAEALAYANRLSDWLFVAGRAANRNGKDDIKWVPGANR
ncbi:MAG: cob(I)yrinic acid a,c-diamide adenosyltransferase [Henriciella sp.]|nr:cob(I)yrinic acid a,c-diamide adenosyltransferase [Henriciella sp.]